MRKRKKFDGHAWLFVIAEKKLKHFARRVADDLPDDLAVLSRIEEESSVLDTKMNLSPFADHLVEQEVGGSVAESEAAGQENGLSHKVTTLMGIYFSNQYRQEILEVY